MFFLIFDLIFSKEVKKQKGAFKYDLFELKLEFLQELESFVKDVSIFGVISVAEVHYSTGLATGAELQTDISQPQLTVFLVITVIRKHQQQFAFLINEYKFAIR
jgi:hypothetical protein